MSAGHSANGNQAPYYYVPADSAHPVRASIALLFVLLGAALWVNLSLIHISEPTRPY